jgi:hypothetical protein
MTTAGPDRLLTAADLLFGSSAEAPEALARQIVSAGRGQNLGRALTHLPRVTQEAAIREAALAAAVLLKVDLVDVLIAGWREHRDIYSAARRTLATPGSKELVGLAPHRISTVQQPAVSILLDGHQVHTLQLGLSIIFEVTGLVAGISHGRLAGLHAGRGELGVALTVHEIEVLTKRTHLELPGVVALRKGFRLLPGHEYPDDAPDGHPGSQLPGSQVSGVEHPVSQFPGVDLLDGQSAANAVPGSEHPGGQLAGPEHPSGQLAGPEHPSSGEADHPGAPWWEKTKRESTRRVVSLSWPGAPDSRRKQSPARISRWISGVNGEPACRHPAQALESKTRFRGHRPGLSTGGSRWWQHHV